MDASYVAGVTRLTNYLQGLPPRGRQMWIDAAYEVFLCERVPEGGQEDRGTSAGSTRASEPTTTAAAGVTR